MIVKIRLRVKFVIIEYLKNDTNYPFFWFAPLITINLLMKEWATKGNGLRMSFNKNPSSN